MAEILLSLTIIGVVAAITLPSLTGNINERTWNTQRKALYARFSQAMALMPAMNGYGTLRETVDGEGSTSIEDTAAETFITSGLAKVLKINNICDNNHLGDCGIASSWNTIDNEKFSVPTKMSELNERMVDVFYSNASYSHSYSQLDTKAVAFETANGESVLAFYYPNCTSLGQSNVSGGSFVPPLLCANFVYDLNGNKGPNTLGKDIGVLSVFYPTDSSVVAPVPHIRDAGNAIQENTSSLCTNQDKDYRLPNLEELMSLFVNQKLFASGSSSSLYQNIYWSSSLNTSTRGWGVNFVSAAVAPYYRNESYAVRCVKRN